MTKSTQEKDYFELTVSEQKAYIERVEQLMDTIDLNVDKPNPIEYAQAIEGLGEMEDDNKKLFILCERGQISFDEMMNVTMKLEFESAS